MSDVLISPVEPNDSENSLSDGITPVFMMEIYGSTIKHLLKEWSLVLTVCAGLHILLKYMCEGLPGAKGILTFRIHIKLS